MEDRAKNQLGANTEVKPKEDCKAIVSVKEGKVRDEKENVELEGGEKEEEKNCEGELKEKEKEKGGEEKNKKIEKERGEDNLPYPRGHGVGRRCESFREIIDQLEITLPLIEALQQIPIYARRIKQYLGEKVDLDEKVNDEQEGCSDLLKTSCPLEAKEDIFTHGGWIIKEALWCGGACDGLNK